MRVLLLASYAPERGKTRAKLAPAVGIRVPGRGAAWAESLLHKLVRFNEYHYPVHSRNSKGRGERFTGRIWGGGGHDGESDKI